MERHNIRGRAELEMTDEGILIRPVRQPDSLEDASHAHRGSAEDLITAMEDTPARWGRWHKLWNQIAARLRR